MTSSNQGAVLTSDVASPRAEPAHLGPLPEWSLSDLYPAPDSPQFAADLERAGSQSQAFAADYRGQLASLAARDLADRQSHLLFDAIRRYEALDDLTGKIGSYASLTYSGDTSDARSEERRVGK